MGWDGMGWDGMGWDRRKPHSFKGLGLKIVLNTCKFWKLA